MGERSGPLRLDDDSQGISDGPVAGPGTNDATTHQDPRAGNTTRIDFGDDSPIIPGPGSGSGGDTGPGTTPGGHGSGSSPGPGGGNGGNGGSNVGGGDGGIGGPATQTSSSGGPSGSGTTSVSYARWSHDRFAQEYRSFLPKMKARLTSLEEGSGKLWVRYGDKIKDFARDKVKGKVKEALGKLPGGNAATKAMDVFVDLAVAREELASASTLKKHPAAKHVSSFTDLGKPDKFLEGFFAGPTSIRAIEFSQRGFTAWKSASGEWFVDRNPHLTPGEYQTMIPPHGNPTPGTAQPIATPDGAILDHYFQKKVKGKPGK